MRIALLSLLFVGACAAPREVVPALEALADENPAEGVVEVSLVAAEADKSFRGGPKTKVWAYNGTVPGPLIETEVGDRMVVHFTNQLPEATTIHWHGVRVPAAMDGTTAMQQPIEPGQSFTYDFVTRDEGLFWFHPHMRSDLQVNKGLYGVIRVRGPRAETVDADLTLVLDDIRLKEDGSISETLDDRSMMMGREGNTLLVNGAVSPRVPIPGGATVRLRLVNVANGRFFNLRAEGISLRVLGTDGSRYEEARQVDRLLIVPGERYEVVFEAPSSGQARLVTEPYDRGHGSMTQDSVAEELALFEFDAKRAVSSPAPLPQGGAQLEALTDGPPEFRATLSEEMGMMETRFLINGAAWPDVTPWVVTPGVRVFEVKNDSEMDHPFHLHGFFFQVLARDGVGEPRSALVNKDTLNVPAKSMVRLAARLDEPGRWLYHCHILEHAEAGMVGEITVR